METLPFGAQPGLLVSEVELVSLAVFTSVSPVSGAVGGVVEASEIAAFGVLKPLDSNVSPESSSGKWKNGKVEIQ